MKPSPWWALVPAFLAAGCGAAVPAPHPPVEARPLAPWLADYDRALAEAAVSGKPVLAYFSAETEGTEAAVFASPEFLEWAKEVVLLRLTAPPADAEDAGSLLRRRGGQGLPYLVFLDGAGDVIAKHTGAFKVASFKQEGASARSLLTLEKRSAGGDHGAAFRVVVSKLELCALDPAEASRLVRSLGTMDPAQQARVDALLRSNELRDALNRLRKDKSSDPEVLRRLLDMKAGGRIPVDPKESRLYWAFVLELSPSADRASRLEESVAAVKAGFPGWLTDYDLALAKAKGMGKPVFAYFTCGPDVSPATEAASFCVSIEGTFSTPSFRKWSDQVVLFCQPVPQAEVESPRALFRRKGGQGLPYLVFLDGAGDVIAKHVGPIGTDDLARTGEAAAAFLDLERKAEGGNAAAAFQVLTCKLDLEPMDPAEASRRGKALGDLPAERRAKLDALLQVNELHDAFKGLTRDPASQVETGRRLLEIKKAGRIPSDRKDSQKFWATLLQFADHEKDPALYEEALNAIKALYPDISKTLLEPREKRLQELQGKRVDTVDMPEDGKDTTPRPQEKP